MIATDRLYAALDIDVEAFALCVIASDTCLVTPPIAAIEVHYVVAGVLHYSVQGLAPLTLPAGSIVMTPAGMPQRLSATPDPRLEVAATAICLPGSDGMVLFDAGDGDGGDLRVLCGKVRADLAGSFGPLDGMAMPIASNFADSPFVRAAFKAMLAETTTGAAGGRVIVSALMKACLVALLRNHQATAKADPGLLAKPGLARAIAQVVGDPAASHTVASLAGEAGMSRSAFAKVFRTTIGVSPMAFVARTRLAKARDMLAGGDLPIASVAKKVGFTNRSHFSRLFHASFGSDPSTYRLRVRDGLME